MKSKFNFSKILVAPDEATEYTCRISVSHGANGDQINLYFNSTFVNSMSLNNKLVEFLADMNKKAIAFRVIPSINRDDLRRDTMKMVKLSPAGIAQFGFGRILKSIRGEIANYKCPIKMYDDDTYGKMFYFELNEQTKTHKKNDSK